MKIKILACSVLYKESMAFSQPFIDSICKQDCNNNVDVLFIYEPDVIFPYSSKMRGNLIIEESKNPTIVDNRIQCIDYAKRFGYDYIFWIDSDDVCYPNKFGTILSLVAENSDIDIIVHDMSIIDGEGNLIRQSYIGNRIRNKYLGMKDVSDYNIMGFANCVFKTEQLVMLLPIPEGITAIDWWMVSILLLSEKRAKYIPIPLTYYRQHNQNIASISDINYSTLQKQVEIIKVHFDVLFAYCIENRIYSYQIEQRRCLVHDYIEKKSAFKIEIIKKLLDRKVEYLWWEFSIAYIKEVTNV